MSPSKLFEGMALNVFKASGVVSMGEISYLVGNIADVRAFGKMIVIFLRR